MHKAQIYLSEQQTEKINIEAKEKGLRFSEMLRRIIDVYFDNKNENKKSV